MEEIEDNREFWLNFVFVSVVDPIDCFRLFLSIWFALDVSSCEQRERKNYISNSTIYLCEVSIFAPETPFPVQNKVKVTPSNPVDISLVCLDGAVFAILGLCYYELWRKGPHSQWSNTFLRLFVLLFSKKFLSLLIPAWISFIGYERMYSMSSVTN